MKSVVVSTVSYWLAQWDFILLDHEPTLAVNVIVKLYLAYVKRVCVCISEHVRESVSGSTCGGSDVGTSWSSWQPDPASLWADYLYKTPEREREQRLIVCRATAENWHRVLFMRMGVNFYQGSVIIYLFWKVLWFRGILCILRWALFYTVSFEWTAYRKWHVTVH